MAMERRGKERKSKDVHVLEGGPAHDKPQPPLQLDDRYVQTGEKWGKKETRRNTQAE